MSVTDRCATGSSLGVHLPSLRSHSLHAYSSAITFAQYVMAVTGNVIPFWQNKTA
jgi:hypothetical protein